LAAHHADQQAQLFLLIRATLASGESVTCCFLGSWGPLGSHEPTGFGLPVALIASSNWQNLGDPPVEGLRIIHSKGLGRPGQNGRMTNDNSSLSNQPQTRDNMQQIQI